MKRCALPFYLLVVLLFSLFIAYASLPVNVLEISGSEGRELIPVENRTTFEISFIHSVELSRWIEIYEVDGAVLHLKKTLTKSAGWGLPSTPSSGNFSFEDVDGEGWMAYYLDRELESLTISTYSINDYILQIGDNRLVLEKFGRLVTIKVKTIPRYEYWRWKVGI